MLKLQAALCLGVLLSGACHRTNPGGAGESGAGSPASHVDAGALCVENALCIRGHHWDAKRCACVPDESAGAGAAGSAGSPAPSRVP
jgi:hypothetical protein